MKFWVLGFFATLLLSVCTVQSSPTLRQQHHSRLHRASSPGRQAVTETDHADKRSHQYYPVRIDDALERLRHSAKTPEDGTRLHGAGKGPLPSLELARDPNTASELSDMLSGALHEVVRIAKGLMLELKDGRTIAAPKSSRAGRGGEEVEEQFLFNQNTERDRIQVLRLAELRLHHQPGEHADPADLHRGRQTRALRHVRRGKLHLYGYESNEERDDTSEKGNI